MRLVGAAGAERARDQGVRGRRRRATPRRARAPARTAPAGAPAAARRRRRAARGGRRRPPARPRPAALRPRRGAAAARWPACDAPRGGAIERGARLGHLGQQRRHARALGRLVRAGERRPRRRRCAASAAPARPRPARPPPRSDGGRPRASRCASAARGLVEAAEQQQPARRDQPRLQRVGAVGARLERGRRRRQRARRAAEVAHGQRHLGLGDDAARARQLLVRAEAARGAPQQLARPRVLAELRHRDAAQRQRRRVVAQARRA